MKEWRTTGKREVTQIWSYFPLGHDSPGTSEICYASFFAEIQIGRIVMRLNADFFVLAGLLFIEARAYPEPRTVTKCALDYHRLNKQLDLRGYIQVGGEHRFVTDQGCRIPFAFGSDYRTLEFDIGLPKILSRL